MDCFSKNRTNVFVYGTLMRGESLHDALCEQVFVSDAITEPLYRLYLIDDYPGLVDALNGDGVAITGEIWSVDQANLKRLDAIECVDSGLYERREIRLTGPIALAQAWFYLHDLDGLPEIGTDWRSR